MKEAKHTPRIRVTPRYITVLVQTDMVPPHPSQVPNKMSTLYQLEPTPREKYQYHINNTTSVHK
jgi:hypothetical protein